jgi:D-sedoheptulose 7-phosphate isomerase
LTAAIATEFARARDTMTALAADVEITAQLDDAARRCVDALRGGRKIMFCGNGGSAADAQHLAGELVSRFNYDRPGLPAMALTTDTSILTAIGNDYGYEQLFARQVEASGVAGDVLVAISTSGNSPNVLRALEAARARKLVTIGLTGRSGGRMEGACDILIRAPAAHTPRVQEAHIVIGHTLCALIESALFPRPA